MSALPTYERNRMRSLAHCQKFIASKNVKKNWPKTGSKALQCVFFFSTVPLSVCNENQYVHIGIFLSEHYSIRSPSWFKNLIECKLLSYTRICKCLICLATGYSGQPYFARSWIFLLASPLFCMNMAGLQFGLQEKQ